jgi:hypothetical protein
MHYLQIETVADIANRFVNMPAGLLNELPLPLDFFVPYAAYRKQEAEHHCEWKSGFLDVIVRLRRS